MERAMRASERNVNFLISPLFTPYFVTFQTPFLFRNDKIRAQRRSIISSALFFFVVFVLLFICLHTRIIFMIFLAKWFVKLFWCIHVMSMSRQSTGERSRLRLLLLLLLHLHHLLYLVFFQLIC